MSIKTKDVMANSEFSFTKLDFLEKNETDMIKISESLKVNLNRRRTIRTFSPRAVDKKIIENCILAASSAPSGANKQPYKFVVISDQKMKEKVKEAAEKEEESFYTKRASKDWLEDLKPFKTNSKKPYLSVAPYLIAIFAKPFDVINDEKCKNYYPIESTGLAAGTLISSLHLSGLATLTHTPSPLNFLNEVLDQPKHYRAMILLVVGYPEIDTEVPDQSRKNLSEISQFI